MAHVTPPKAPRLFLVDGYALIYRAFYALLSRPLTTKRGENTSAAWGIATFLKLLRSDHGLASGEYIGWVLDSGLSFRHEEYSAYKATRQKLSEELQKIIDERTEPWGVHVISVEVKDVLIPSALEDAMSMQAQAERERQARVILGDSERQVARKFEEASQSYIHNPVALHLRAMNMLYEGLKANSTIVLVPSTALESMQLGGIFPRASMHEGNGGAKNEEHEADLRKDRKSA